MPARPRSGDRTRCMRTGRSARGPPDGGRRRGWGAGDRVVGAADQRFWHSNAQTARSMMLPNAVAAQISPRVPTGWTVAARRDLVHLRRSRRRRPVQPRACSPLLGRTTAETRWSSASNGTAAQQFVVVDHGDQPAGEPSRRAAGTAAPGCGRSGRRPGRADGRSASTASAGTSTTSASAMASGPSRGPTGSSMPHAPRRTGLGYVAPVQRRRARHHRNQHPDGGAPAGRASRRSSGSVASGRYAATQVDVPPARPADAPRSRRGRLRRAASSRPRRASISLVRRRVFAAAISSLSGCTATP